MRALNRPCVALSEQSLRLGFFLISSAFVTTRPQSRSTNARLSNVVVVADVEFTPIEQLIPPGSYCLDGKCLLVGSKKILLGMIFLLSCP